MDWIIFTGTNIHRVRKGTKIKLANGLHLCVTVMKETTGTSSRLKAKHLQETSSMSLLIRWFIAAVVGLRRSLVVTTLLLVFLALGAEAQPSSTGTLAQVTPAERRAVVDSIGKLLERGYVFPDVALRSGEAIRKQLDAKAYDTIHDARAFAERLTADLQAINHDKHMRVVVRPASTQPDAPGDPVADRIREQQRMNESNYGFQRVERFEGNVGYLDLRGFFEGNAGRERGVAAMALLSSSDAVVIDLRRNGGGSPEMVRFLASYFFDKPTHINSIYNRMSNTTRDFWTLDEVPGKRMTDVPLFILTSDYTFSGAEEFAYDMQTQRRATIVGDTTGGGANPGGVAPVNDRFGIFIPTGRAINPVTKTNWEGVGVRPEIVVTSEHAFDSVLALARAAAEEHRTNTTQRLHAVSDSVMRGISTALKLTAQHRNAEAARVISDALQYGISNGALDEDMVNQMGYDRLISGQTDIAIAIFTVNVKAFPASANVYDSLGEAYLKQGDTVQGVANYRKSFELDPANENARKIIEKIGD